MIEAYARMNIVHVCVECMRRLHRIEKMYTDKDMYQDDGMLSLFMIHCCWVLQQRPPQTGQCFAPWQNHVPWVMIPVLGLAVSRPTVVAHAQYNLRCTS